MWERDIFYFSCWQTFLMFCWFCSGLKEETEERVSKLLKEEIGKSLRDVFYLQEERVHLLNDFDLKFKTYLLDAPKFNLETLKSLCQTTSERMNDISRKILNVRDKFSSECFNVKCLYDLIDKLQEGEQKKFKLVWTQFFY